MAEQITAFGIDVGSTTVKVVAINNEGKIIRHRVEPTEPHIESQVKKLFCDKNIFGGLASSLPIIATGYGRKLVKEAEGKLTEIRCHARGVYESLGHGGTLIDIGGQDTKVVTLGNKGGVLNFAMNDKCAAGTGRFLENTASRLHIPLEEMGQLAENAKIEAQISSTCVVFAESEIVSLIAHGTPVDQIVRGLHTALVQRIASLVRSAGLVSPVILSGGVAKNPAIKLLLAKKLDEKVLRPNLPQLMGAFGAALIAREKAKVQKKPCSE